MCKFYIGYIKIHVSYAVKPQGCQYSNGGNQMQARDLKNIIESEKDYKVEIAAPGLTKDDFSIRIDDDNQISVSMEKKEEHKDENKNGRYLRREFSYTQFRQNMILPDNIDKDKIEAKVENGILTIDIPKKEIIPEKPAVRNIEVK